MDTNIPEVKLLYDAIEWAKRQFLRGDLSSLKPEEIELISVLIEICHERCPNEK